jgi:hypothetical protein
MGEAQSSPGVVAALLLLQVGNLCRGRRFIDVRIPFEENAWGMCFGGGAVPCCGCLGCIARLAAENG